MTKRNKMFKDEKEFKKVVDRLNIDSKPNPAHRENLKQQMLSAFNETLQKYTTPFGVFRRTIMRNSITKLVAAAAIIITVLIGIHQFGDSAPAFADIVKPILTARTATFKITHKIGDKKGNGIRTIKGEGMFMEPGLMRNTMEADVIRIENIQEGKILMLDPEKKTARIFELKNISDNEKRKANLFREIRRLIQQAQQSGDESIEYLGKQEIEGQTAIGYNVQESGEDTIVWANAETLLPIRIEYYMTEMMGGEFTYILSDFNFNVELDESLFSLEIPEGYTVDTVQMDVSKPEEKELLETFRLWTDAFGDIPAALDIKKIGGKFPPALDVRVVVGIMEVLATKAGFKKGMDPSDPKFQEAKEDFETARRGIRFVHTLPESSDWHYAGKDVKLGDGDTAIFWYRPDGSETYRVIYGDLSIKDVAPENLPK